MEVLNIEIIKCDLRTVWYFGLEGERFKVYKSTKDYILKEDYDLGHKACWRHIKFDDCMVIEGS